MDEQINRSALHVLTRNTGITIPNRIRAVEGLSGAAALYTLFGVLLTYFLGGIATFGFLAMVLDVLFIGAMIAIAILTRAGDQNCDLIQNEDSLPFGPDGLGDPNSSSAPSTYHACTLLKACWILSIIGAILFLLSIPYQLLIVQHHRKEKQTNPHVKYGMFGRRGQKNPPNTPVVASQKRGFWRRNPKVSADAENGAYTNGTEPKYATNNAVNY